VTADRRGPLAAEGVPATITRGERHHPAAGRSGRTRLRRRGGPV